MTKQSSSSKQPRKRKKNSTPAVRPVTELPMPRPPKEKSAVAPRMAMWVLLGGMLFMVLVVITATIGSGTRGVDEGQGDKKAAAVSKAYLKAQSKAKLRIEIISDKINFRSDRYIDPTNLIGTWPRGTRLVVLDTKSTWYRVIAPDGRKGWVTSDPEFSRKIRSKKGS